MSKKKRILFILDTLEVGGAEKSTLEISKYLKDIEPVVCSIFKGDALKRDFESAGIKLIQLNIDSYLYLFPAVKALKKIIEKEKPDVVHATLARAELVARVALKNSKIPLVGSLVGDTYNAERYTELSKPARVKLKMFQYLDQITAKRVDVFLSISQFLKDSYVNKLGLPAAKIIIVPRGRHITEADKPADRFEPFLFLSVGRLIQLKGQADIIKAIAIVKQKYPQVKLKIAGEGPWRAVLEQTIKETGTADNVELLGRVNNVDEWLARAQFFVFGSYYEGQGGAVVEAMLAGKAIIASDIDVVKESVNDGRSALLFKVKDVENLAEKMIWAIEHPGEMAQLSVNAYAEAKEKFDIINIVRKHEEVYTSLMAH
ncbi:MAG: glycosyltransferase family 1 protein [Sphingobacteriales bacterium]|nr:MAG: glycosyltransferase family 1 protein [Sphingobacteriales bacterium]